MAINNIQIEKGIKVPTWQCTQYPFDRLKVGESFQVQDSVSLITAASMYSKRHPPIKFSTRKMGDGNRRVWRVA
jgi:hypothetical protein